jgi:hypothetical protein
MVDQAKSLDAMTAVERADLIATVVHALEACAHAAKEAGDLQFGSNSRVVVGSLRTFGNHFSKSDAKPLEMLLEQGIRLIQSYSNRSQIS